MKEHHCTSIVPLFNHLSEEEQDKIESLVIHRHFNKGETVWQPGDDPLLIIVASGSMKVYMIAGNGREQLLRLLTPGSITKAPTPSWAPGPRTSSSTLWKPPTPASSGKATSPPSLRKPQSWP